MLNCLRLQYGKYECYEYRVRAYIYNIHMIWVCCQDTILPLCIPLKCIYVSLSTISFISRATKPLTSSWYPLTEIFTLNATNIYHSILFIHSSLFCHNILTHASTNTNRLGRACRPIVLAYNPTIRFCIIQKGIRGTHSLSFSRLVWGALKFQISAQNG